MNSERTEHPVPVYKSEEEQEEVDMIDDWYSVFKFGNIFYPQTTTATTIVTLERLLNPINPKIIRFAAHTLTAYQTDNLGRSLSQHHRRNGVGFQYNRNPTRGQRKRVRDIWEQTKVDVLDCLSVRFRRELLTKEQLIREAQLIQEAVDEQIELHEISYAETLAASKFLFDPEGIQFSDLYREEVIKGSKTKEIPRGMVMEYLQSRLFSSGHKERDYAWLKIV